jgi:hypothetical protein
LPLEFPGNAAILLLDWMSQPNYLKRIETARSTKSSRTSADAYAQMDRMVASTSGPFTTRASGDSSAGQLKGDAATKRSNR